MILGPHVSAFRAIGWIVGASARARCDATRTYHKLVKTTPKPRATKKSKGELVGPPPPPPPPLLGVGGGGGAGEVVDTDTDSVGDDDGESMVRVNAGGLDASVCRGRRTDASAAIIKRPRESEIRWVVTGAIFAAVSIARAL